MWYYLFVGGGGEGGGGVSRRNLGILGSVIDEDERTISTFGRGCSESLDERKNGLSRRSLGACSENLDELKNGLSRRS